MELWYIKGVDTTGAEDIGLYQGFYKSEYEARGNKKRKIGYKFNYQGMKSVMQLQKYCLTEGLLLKIMYSQMLIFREKYTFEQREKLWI